MRKSLFLAAILFASFAYASKPVDNLSYAKKMADSEMKRHPESWQLDNQTSLKWDYGHGVELQGFLDLYEACGNVKYRDYVIAFADTMINTDGSIKSYNLSDYNIDRVNTGKILFRVYDYTKNEKYIKALKLLRSQMDTHPRNDDGGFWHKKVYPNQMWLDGIYMASPFLAEYAKRFNQPQDYKMVITQFITAARHTYDPANGLYRHACDVSRKMFWADSITGQSKHAWGRAMGWYAMAIVDALDFIPKDVAGRDSMLNILNNIAFQLKRIQDSKTGLWYQVLDRSGDKGNYLESSCSAMFIYALLKAVRMNYINASYRDVAIKAYQGYLKEFVEFDKEGLMNITKACAVAGLGGSNNRSGTYDYYIHEQIRSNDVKAIGPFLMACVEIDKYTKHAYEVVNNMPTFYQQAKGQLTYPLAWRNAKGKNFNEWRNTARKALLTCLKNEPPAPKKYEIETIDKEKRNGYEARKIYFNVSEWSRVPAYLLVPDGKGPFPAILMLHDHGAHFSIGKEKMVRPFNVSKIVSDDADDWVSKCYDNQYVGDYFASQGYVVLSVDALFWGERGQKEGINYDGQQALAANLMQMGMSLGGVITSDDVKSAEFLASLPEVNPKEIGALGFSMGSYRAWMASAATDCIKAAASICWMNTTDSLMTMTNNQNKGGSAFSMLVPNLRLYMDYPDVASIACPKPALFFNGTRDKLFPVEGVKAAYNVMHDAWKSQNAEERLTTKIWDEKHLFNKDMQRETLEFFNRWLK